MGTWVRVSDPEADTVADPTGDRDGEAVGRGLIVAELGEGEGTADRVPEPVALRLGDPVALGGVWLGLGVGVVVTVVKEIEAVALAV